MFSCISCCVSFASYLKCVAGTWMGRGIVHIVVGGCGIAIYGKHHGGTGNGANLGMALLCLVVATLYILASCNGEAAPNAAAAAKDKPTLLPGAEQFGGEDGEGGGATRYEPFGDPESGEKHSAGFGADEDDDGIGSNPFAS